MNTHFNTPAKRRLLLLYITQKFNLPLTEDQFIKIILDNDWMTFFDFKEALDNLMETGQVKLEQKTSIQVYTLTEEGLNTLSHFENTLPLSVRKGVDEYIRLHNEQIKKETLLESSYTYLPDGRMEVTCHVREKTGELMTLTLYVEREDYAKAICQNWNKTSPTIYSLLLQKLLY